MGTWSINSLTIEHICRRLSQLWPMLLQDLPRIARYQPSSVVLFACSRLCHRKRKLCLYRTSINAAISSILLYKYWLSSSVMSFGVMLDWHLTFDDHVVAVSKACYFHIRALRHIWASLPDDVAKMITCSIICSRLDYYNSLLVGMSENNFSKLQLVQSTLARVVTGATRYDHMKKEVIHITPVLAQLHWLPVKQRVSFKLATLVYSYTGLQHPPVRITFLPWVTFHLPRTS